MSDLDEVARTLAIPQGIDDLCTRDSPPLLAVDVSDAGVDVETGRTLRALPLVTVAVASGTDVAPAVPGLGAFDVVIGDEGAADVLPRLLARVEANPIASVSLVQLLRMSEGLGVVDGLTAESFTYSMLQGGPEFGHWLRTRRAPTRTGVNSEPLRVERTGAVLDVTFCRPEIRNAFGFEVRDALVEALQLAAADTSISSIVLTGEGASFCSGGDLREFGTAVDPATAHTVRTARSAAFWLDRVRDRLRAEIHGDCIGSGIELPAFAGHVSAKGDLRVRLPEIAMGLVPGAGGTVSLPRRIGRQRTNFLALTGETVDAGTATAWGLVDEIV